MKTRVWKERKIVSFFVSLFLSLFLLFSLSLFLFSLFLFSSFLFLFFFFFFPLPSILSFYFPLPLYLISSFPLPLPLSSVLMATSIASAPPLSGQSDSSQSSLYRNWILLSQVGFITLLLNNDIIFFVFNAPFFLLFLFYISKKYFAFGMFSLTLH